MSIADIINGTGAAGSASQGSGVKKKDQLGQDEFLKLMIAQLKNQDPFKPMDPAQYLGQLAQFSTVSGIAEIKRRSARCRSRCVRRRCSTARPWSAATVLVPSDEVDAAGGRLGEGRDRRADRHERRCRSIFAMPAARWCGA